MHTPRSIVALFLCLTLGVASALYYPRHAQQVAQQAQLGILLAPEVSPPPLQERSKMVNCAVRGELPDPSCTPGQVFSAKSLAQICTPGYTATVRSVSEKMRKEVYAEYGIPFPQPRGGYEVDHLVPLALGGDNDIANLWPEAAEPAPGFREKDLVEVYLHEEACAGRADISVGQRQVARDWLAVYQRMPADVIARLKAEYRNWSN